MREVCPFEVLESVLEAGPIEWEKALERTTLIQQLKMRFFSSFVSFTFSFIIPLTVGPKTLGFLPQKPSIPLRFGQDPLPKSEEGLKLKINLKRERRSKRKSTINSEI